MNYKVYQGTELKQTVTSKTAVMNGLQPNRNYEFSVEPDNVNNLLLGTTQPFSMTGTNTTNQCDYANSLINGYNVSSLASKFGTQFTVSFDWSVSGSSPSGSFSAQWDDVPWNGGGIWNVTPVSSSNTSGHISNTISVSTDSKNVATMLGFRLDNFVGTITFTNLKLVKGSSATTSVTTRGIRFNIPKTLMVGSTITLRYEEYPLGIVPIGNEPSGMFGGGNKQNLSAKVISTANGSSVVEVAGNVIDVGGRNLYIDTLNFSNPSSWWGYGSWRKTTDTYNGLAVMHTIASWNGISQYIQVKKGDILTYSVYAKYTSGTGTSTIYWGLNQSTEDSYSTASVNPGASSVDITDSWQRISGTTVATIDGYLRPRLERNAHNANTLQISGIKLETGDTATPYASFVDGDTFTAQPDGTFALFSEYKALYY